MDIIVASYNVFIGTAVGLGVESAWCPFLKGPRLESQLSSLRTLSPHLLGLQELMSHSLVNAFRAAFSSTHTLLHAHYSNPLGVALLALWRVVACGGILGLLTLLVHALLPHHQWLNSLTLFLTLSTPLAVCLVYQILIPTACTPASFLVGENHGGLGLLVSKSKFKVLAHYCRDFENQGGDCLNLLRKRAYQCALLEVVAPSGGCPPHPPALLLVLHTHANLGQEESRTAQLMELVEACSERALEALLEGAGLKGVIPPASIPTLVLGDFNAPFSSHSISSSLGKAGFVDAWGVSAPPGMRPYTWDNEMNPLCDGLLHSPNDRVDLILCRGPHCTPSDTNTISSMMKGTGGLSLTPTSSCIAMNTPPYLSDHFAALTTFRVEFGGDKEGGEESVPSSGCESPGTPDQNMWSSGRSNSSEPVEFFE